MSYTYRQLFTKHLPEPYRSQAIANAVAQDRDVDDPSDTAGIDPEDLYDVVACSFTWKYSPEGHDYWQRASGGEFEVSELRLEAQPATHRLLEVGETIQQGDEVEELDGWRQVSVFPINCNIPGVFRRALIAEPLAVDPGTGYRLLEEGETIFEGDEEADEEEGGGWLKVRFTGAVYNPRSWYPVRRKIAAPTYRLLNQGEIIREGDEVYLRLGWEAMGDDCAVGANHDPQFQRPIRREIKSHEDA